MTDTKKMEALAAILRSMSSAEIESAIDIFRRVRAEADTKKIVNDGIVVGTKVTFHARGQKQVGLVTGYTSKKIKVDCQGMKWNVPVSMLTVVKKA